MVSHTKAGWAKLINLNPLIPCFVDGPACPVGRDEKFSFLFSPFGKGGKTNSIIN